MNIWILTMLFGFLTLLNLRCGSGAKIIMSSPQFPSHIHQQLELGYELVRRGHEVYAVVGSRYPKWQMIEKMGINVLFYEVPDDVVYGVSEEFEIFIANTIFNKTTDMPETSAMANRDCTFMMEDQVFLKTVRNLNFDFAIVDPFSLAPCTLILPTHLRIPFISLAYSVIPWRCRLPALPSFFQAMNPLQIFDERTFIGRFENLLSYVILELGIFFPGVRNTTLLTKFAPEFDSWGELVRRSELFLISSDHNMGRSLPIFPNIITIAGLTCRPPKQLDPNLESVLNSSKDGAILMSFGSTAYHMPKDVILKFFEAFSRLKETVIARLPTPDGVTVPENVKLLSWLPQNDILGHINTKLFITHCGITGQQEALYHGVPMIGFPLFAEQRMNCRISYLKGFGLTMSIQQFTANDLVENIRQVISNPMYTSNINRASQIFRDQPISARDKAVFWVEHVIKYGGSHLRSPAMDQPLYQFLMLDILAVLFVIIFAFLGLAKIVLWTVCSRLFRAKEPHVKIKSN